MYSFDEEQHCLVDSVVWIFFISHFGRLMQCFKTDTMIQPMMHYYHKARYTGIPKCLKTAKSFGGYSDSIEKFNWKLKALTRLSKEAQHSYERCNRILSKLFFFMANFNKSSKLTFKYHHQFSKRFQIIIFYVYSEWISFLWLKTLYSINFPKCLKFIDI